MLKLWRWIGVVFVSTLVAVGLPLSAAADWGHTCLPNRGCSWLLSYTGTQPAVPPTQSVWWPPTEPPDPCEYRQLMTQPPPDSPLWGGHDPEHGRLWQAFCPTAIDLGNHAGDGFTRTDGSEVYYVDDGSYPNATAPTNPVTLANEVRDRIVMPDPQVHFGPDFDEVAVKVPVWLWTEPEPPIVQTGTAGPFTATVTATLIRTTWDMGEPVDPATPGRRPAPMVCDGGGTPFSAGADPGHPPCGYTYVWRSLPERTGGAGAWNVMVTATWEVTAVVTGGAAGTITETDTVDMQATAAVEVREWRSILVDSK